MFSSNNQATGWSKYHYLLCLGAKVCITLVTALGLLGHSISLAGTIPQPSVTILYAHARRTFRISSFAWRPEITPRVFGLGNGRRMYIHPGAASHLCRPSGNDNLIAGNVLPNYSECEQWIKPARIWMVDSTGNPIPNGEWDGQNDATGRDIWNFAYDGAFGYAIVASQTEGNLLFVIRHNEHQNVLESPTSYGYQGHIVPGRSVWTPCQRAGYWELWPDCTHKDTSKWVNDWNSGGSYGSFVSLGRFNIDPYDGDLSGYTDFGPVVWPSKGFLTAPPGSNPAPYRPTTGHSLPNLFYPSWLHDPEGDAWMYVFYVNHSDIPNGTQGQCISVARGWAGIEAGYTPTSWRNWSGTGWAVQSVPADMRYSDMENYYVGSQTTPRPYQAACIVLENRWLSNWFQVAKIMDANGQFTGRFLGVETRENMDTHEVQMGIRYSEENSLTQWGPITVLDSATGDGNLRYTYPTFYNLEGNSNVEIRLNDFFIVGLKPNEGSSSDLYLLRLRLNNVP